MISSTNEQKLTYGLMVAPAMFFYLLVISVPVIFSVFLGFTEYDIIGNTMEIVGVEHYGKMFTDARFWSAFSNNMWIVGVSVFGQIPVGFMLAYFLYRRMVNAQSFFQAMVFLPQTISTIIVGVLWRSIFSPSGLATSIVRNISGNQEFLFEFMKDQTSAMIAIGGVLMWMYTGFYMLTFLANLQRIDGSVIESAMIDGASEARIFIQIIVPALMGTVVVNAIMAIAGSLRGFDLIWAMTGGGPANKTEVLPIYMYQHTFRNFDYSYGSAVATVIVAISVLLILVVQLISKKFEGTEV